MNGHGQKLSIVIPVLWDTAALRRLLMALTNMPRAADEIVCVDGGADPECRQLCEEAGALYIASEAGRGIQLDTGARTASGEWLWFLHADATPDRGAAAAVRDALGGGAVGGWFRFRFEGVDHFLARGIATLTNWRCRFGVPYGDQGLFMTANAYRIAGGFPDEPLFEEVSLVRALRRMGRFRGLPLSIGVSPRRWQRDGWLRRSLSNRLLAMAHATGVPPRRLARSYRQSTDHGQARS